MKIEAHTKTASEILEIFHTNEQGLDPDEARKRLEQYGLNKLPEAKLDGLVVIFLRQFQSPLIYILFLASSVVFLMGEFIDGLIILFVLLFNAIVGTIQEGKAQNTLQALKKFAATNATVIRNGKEIVIPDYEVVPGDIIILQEGDKIPADARVILSNNVTVDESALTGESLPVHKDKEVIQSPNLPIADQKNMVFKGTHVVAGNGRAIVVATGLDTILGTISKEIAVIKSEIPLKANIRSLTRLIVLMVVTICVSLFTLGIFLGHSVKTMFTTVVSLAVSVIPEGLPIVMTLVLATGVWRMSKRNALVKKLQAVEALGQARVIAVDKTGTITKNEITLQKVYVNGKTFNIGDSVADLLSNQEVLFAGELATYGANNNSDPTEVALSVFAQKLGLHKDVLEKKSPKLSEIPFDYKNKYHAAAYRVEGTVLTTVVGAPETIIGLSSDVWYDGKSSQLSNEKRGELESVFEQMSQEGLRILAFAFKGDSPEDIQSKDVVNLTFVGFFGLKDNILPVVH
ncbi:HAD-IC family P-type ATPase [Candidatus Roizmanbacteria bacterium]|nr:HAD-IC family P-type ATPase [Candidatus Roizmanbacteria bacterium]